MILSFNVSKCLYKYHIYPYLAIEIQCLHNIIPGVISNIHIHIHIHTYTYTYTNTYVRTYIHPFMHTCIHPCIHPSVHPCMHTSMHTSIHTYIERFKHKLIIEIHTMVAGMQILVQSDLLGWSSFIFC